VTQQASEAPTNRKVCVGMQQQQQQQDAEQQRDAAAGRRAAHLAPASVTSTPRVVETPREVARDLEMQDLVLQLQVERLISSESAREHRVCVFPPHS